MTPRTLSRTSLAAALALILAGLVLVMSGMTPPRTAPSPHPQPQPVQVDPSDRSV